MAAKRKQSTSAGAPEGERGKDRLYLLDAMALAYRAHFIFISRPLINSKGMNTSAAYGFTSALLKLLEEKRPEHIAVVFDSLKKGGKKNFRDELYEHYKAHRPPMPDGLREAIPYMKEIVRALNIPALEEEGVEADDVIGTLARHAEEEGVDVVIVSPDKDFQQLLSPSICIMRPAYRGEEFDPITDGSFREKFGVEPPRFIDILALLGDTSDNVPGVPGIGEKTAPSLIQEFGTVENLLDHAAEIKAKRVRESLLAHREQALLSKQLVTIKTDVEVAYEWDDLRLSTPDEPRLAQLFEELEFTSMLERVRNRLLAGQGPAVAAAPAPPGLFDEEPDLAFDFGPYAAVERLDEDRVRYEAVRTRAALEALAARYAGLKRFAVDTETTSRDEMEAALIGCSLSREPFEAAYVPVPLPDHTTTAEALDVLRPLLENPAAEKVGQNLKYDLIVLARHGLRLQGPLFDTMVAHYLLEPEEPHNLDALARKFLNYQTIPITDLIGTGRNQKPMQEVELEPLSRYACEDADVSLRLAEILRRRLEEDGLLKIAEEMEFPLVYVLAEMERTGVRVRADVLEEISAQLEEQIRELEARVHEAAGEPFNIGSPKQLGQILFEKLGLKVGQKTATGQHSTNERVMQQLATEHPLPGLVLDWRKLTKLKSTYVDALGGLVNPETGRIHTSFNQTVAATGRLSSSNPNLQNIPVRSDIGREVRRAFIAADGFRFVAADYVQIELRIIASMSRDPELMKAFAAGQDIHTATAARVFGVRPEEVTRDQRRKAKEVNYAIPYGISAFELAQRLRTDFKEATALIDQYHRSYPAVSTLLNRMVEEARAKGYVETLLGRRRYVPNINARNRAERSFAERVAVNMPVQGTQADMIKLAMVRIHRRIREEELRSRMILQVHDELVFEVVPEELERMKEIIRTEMTAALPLEVPVEVEIGVGDNWLDAH